MMRKNNVERMTIVEQLIAIKEETCDFACMFKEYVEDQFEDEHKRQEILSGYCLRCPLGKLHYQGVSGSNPEHPLGELHPQPTH